MGKRQARNAHAIPTDPVPSRSVNEGGGNTEDSNHNGNKDYHPSQTDSLAKHSAPEAESTTSGETRQIRKRVRPGKLARLNTISTDVFLEIASHLQPMDVLNMARTTKSWRALLMSKTSKPIWRAARSSIPELPECPEDLSEAQYVRLMFGTDCYVCGTRSVPWTSFELRKRVCKACAKDTVKEVDEMRYDVFEYCHKADIDNILELVPYCEGAPHKRNSFEGHYFAPDVVKIQALERSCMCNDDYEKWLKATKASVSKIMRGASELRDFQVRWRTELCSFYDEKSRRRDENKRSRKTEIELRFRELGYDPRDIQFPGVNEVHLARPLTERAWLKIRPTLEQTVIQQRETRLNEEDDTRRRAREAELYQLYVTLKADLANPPDTVISDPPQRLLRLADFYHLPSIFPLWTSSTPITAAVWPSATTLGTEITVFWTAVQNDLATILLDDMSQSFPGPVEQEVTAKCMLRLKTKGLETPWHYQSTNRSPRRLITVFPESLRSSLPPLPDVEGGTRLLTESTTVFACSKCHEPLLWPDLLSHTHHYEPSVHTHKTPESSVFGRLTAWSPDFVYTSVLLRKLMRSITMKVGRPRAEPRESMKAHLETLLFERQCCESAEDALDSSSPVKWSIYVKHCVDSYHGEQMAAECDLLRETEEYKRYSDNGRLAVDAVIKRFHGSLHNFESDKPKFAVHRKKV